MARILIVDDAVFMRTTLKNFLEKNGHQVIGEAGNGQEGFEKYKQLKPDIVTMDITMPEMTGIQSLQAIKEFDAQALVIMVSAMGQEKLVLEAIQSGAKSFVVKPFTEEKLMQTISQCI